MWDIARPQLEGSVSVAPGRRLGFAEFGAARGRTVIWMHGTPGARRQIPTEARAFAERAEIRLIGIDRPGVGSSTTHTYGSVLEFADDLDVFADVLGIGEMAIVGLSGGGPYTLAAAHALPDRVVAAGVIGGVPPTRGPDASRGGLLDVATALAPVLATAGTPIGLAASTFVRFARPVASPIIDLYGLLSPEGDRRLLARPEFKAMFLDDLLHGGRKQFGAPFADVVLFARDWGFELGDVQTPVRWWHGDCDHIIPYRHGEHVVDRLPNATITPMPGESHLGGLGRAEEILTTLMDLWDRKAGVTSLQSRSRSGGTSPAGR
ncbi:alpha/beta hydrolase [Rhodococcus triatomae]|uniref:Pimeloyl-ACP methyl ester carboxylesterase n=1 Tax=Rhodococcus triatomae TaxID=300028 RepID=A0A1G8GW62_9NOCA|nr:alpha/beta hydrolase [Rhodococcus triatomae]QNG20282.1 alpha/beta hydrolase [Rhodococcus triatomae]QNG23803.1 alpha/beta hydrolase [Rhodococcus triatomae]SDH98627.1 Pimeloyl-ACP methyl ester carboxylesterase [Rhodococcus triatomae]